MAVRYNKLWKILIDKKMKKKDLQEAAHITRYQMMKLARMELYDEKKCISAPNVVHIYDVKYIGASACGCTGI